MNIIYFHGFASSGASGTVDLLRKHLPECGVTAPDIPIDPQEALPYLKEVCAQTEPDLIIGTSMGGMYAQQMRGYLRICVNPAFFMSELTEILKIGTWPYFNRRENGDTEFVVTPDIIEHFREMEKHQFEGITPWDAGLCYGLFGKNDSTVNTYRVFLQHYAKASLFDGEHRLNDSAMKHHVLPLVKELLSEKPEYEENNSQTNLGAKDFVY
jgi:predicted esterase YcpF (UPF0227 family)